MRIPVKATEQKKQDNRHYLNIIRVILNASDENSFMSQLTYIKLTYQV